VTNRDVSLSADDDPDIQDVEHRAKAIFMGSVGNLAERGYGDTLLGYGDTLLNP